MSKRTSKKANQGGNIMEALDALSAEKNISKDILIEAIKKSILDACKKQYKNADNIRVVLDEEKNEFHVYQDKEVVEEVENPSLQISLEEAEKEYKVKELGATVSIEIEPKNFQRIPAQTAKQTVVQKIREEERSSLYEMYSELEKNIVTGVVQRKMDRNYLVNIGKTDAILSEMEQVKTEQFQSHEKIKLYITEVKNTNKGPKVIISRTHPELVKRLFELQVSEIQNGVVELVNVSREPGSRSKIAVRSMNPDVDPVGACVGVNGSRVNAVVEELRGEKIDIIEWDENPQVFIEHALSPSRVLSVTVDPEEKTSRVIVPDYQLSLAIGKEGQNVRLAAKLTGYKIDIKSETQALEESE